MGLATRHLRIGFIIITQVDRGLLGAQFQTDLDSDHLWPGIYVISITAVSDIMLWERYFKVFEAMLLDLAAYGPMIKGPAF